MKFDGSDEKVGKVLKDLDLHETLCRNRKTFKIQSNADQCKKLKQSASEHLHVQHCTIFYLHGNDAESTDHFKKCVWPRKHLKTLT